MAIEPTIPSARLNLLVQSIDPQRDDVVVEDLRSGRRERFASLQALARTWIGAPETASPDSSCGDASVP
jgi:hypothetical protein